MSDPAKIEQFIELTGADAETAKAVLEASKGDMEAALAIHFGNDEDAPMPSAEEPPAEAPPALPTESTESSVDGILSNARQEGDGPAASTFQGQGRALGSRDEEAAPAAAESPPDAPEPPAVDRSNAKKVRVIFWADGFTVEDVTAEEEAAAAAARAPPAARRTGISSLRDNAPPGGAPPMPKLPELRKYEENAEFMRDLQASIPPREFRELDLSTGAPRPRPVDIMLGDMRPQAFPAELVKRQNAMQQAASAPPKKPSFAAFTGAGQTLGGSGDASSSSGADAAATASSVDGPSATATSGGGPWPLEDRPVPTVDAGAPTTSVQVRLSQGGPQRFQLNKSHTVADLKKLVEGALAAAGAAPRAYTLAAGFPPKPLTDDDATIEGAGLVGAAVNQRWS